MSQQWKELLESTSSWKSLSETVKGVPSLAHSLSDSLSTARSLQETLKTARQFLPDSLANWVPEQRTIKVNPTIWHSFADGWASQVSLAQSLQHALDVFPQSDTLRSLQSSYFGIAGQFNSDVFKKRDDSWVPMLLHTNEEATAIVNQSMAAATITANDMERLEVLITDSFATIRNEIKKSSRSPLTIASFVLTVISLILSLIPLLVDHYKELDPQNATKHDVEEVRKFITAKYEDAVTQFLPQRLVRLRCPVRLRPSKHGKVLQTLRVGDKVTIINTNHKWANISFLDNDKWPVTGWVLKKNLTAPKNR